MYQFNIVFGILIAFLSNYFLQGVGGSNDWRWMLGVMAIPAVIYTVMCRMIPESPRWLIGHRNDRKGAAAIFREADPGLSAAEADAMADTISANFQHRTATNAGGFWSRRLMTPILLAFLIAFFNQLSGINAVLYFAKRIFEQAGFGGNAALLVSVGLGVTNFIFTYVGLALIDRLGRKSLMYIGSFGYIVSLGMVSWAFYAHHPTLVPIFIFAFIAAHAIGQGTVIWVFIAEIFPNEHRARGQTLGSSTHWVFAALLTTYFPTMVKAFHPGGVFAFFAGMMILQLLWVAFMMPETKGTTLENFERTVIH